MITNKALRKTIALLLALTFIFTNTAYSSEAKLRVPLQLKTEEGQRRAQELMGTTKPGAAGGKLASNETAANRIAAKYTQERLGGSMDEASKVQEIQGTALNLGVAEKSGRPVYILDFNKAALALDQLLASKEDMVLLIDLPDGGKVPDPYPVIRRFLEEKSRTNSNVKGLVVRSGNMRNLNNIDLVEKLLIPVIAVETSEELSVIEKADKITLASDGRIRVVNTENIVASVGSFQDLISAGDLKKVKGIAMSKGAIITSKGVYEPRFPDGSSYRDTDIRAGFRSKLKALRDEEIRKIDKGTEGEEVERILTELIKGGIESDDKSGWKTNNERGVAAEMAKAALKNIGESRALNVIGLVETATGAKVLKTGL